MTCDGTYPVWQVTLDVAFHPLCLPVEYKYVVCSAGGGMAGEFDAVKWETDICNRIAFLPLARAQVMAQLLLLLLLLLIDDDHLTIVVVHFHPFATLPPTPCSLLMVTSTACPRRQTCLASCCSKGNKQCVVCGLWFVVGWGFWCEVKCWTSLSFFHICHGSILIYRHLILDISVPFLIGAGKGVAAAAWCRRALGAVGLCGACAIGLMGGLCR